MNEAELARLIAECDPAMCHAELVALCLEIQSLRVGVVLEIGVHRGGSLLVWRRLFDPVLMIGVDNAKLALQAGKSTGAHILSPCWSQDASTYEAVCCLLTGHAVDLLIIDGGHKLVEVQRDYGLYSPLVRDGGAIVLHDTHAALTDECQVSTFWQTLKGENAREFHFPGARASTGMGLVYKRDCKKHRNVV